MYYVPQRARTTDSGACSHCVKKKQRCYIGVRGVPCSSCRRQKRSCDGKATREMEMKKPATQFTYCEETLFASQIQKTAHDAAIRNVENPAVLATNPLDNYISIVNQLLEPSPTFSSGSIGVPDYIAELPDRLDENDLEFLASKGALCLPTAKFRGELLNAYILWVHPQIPVLNLDEFLKAIVYNDGMNRISLLLFHAAMYAASAFVEIDHIRDEGYPSRKAAREVLFSRAKALFELDCENDRLSMVQAALLMVHWNDVPEGQKDASHWIGICLSLSFSIGLHRSPEGAEMTHKSRQAWRRTWWSVYNHARLTSEELLTMMSIQDEAHDAGFSKVDMVTLDDFQFGVHPREVRAVAGNCDVLSSVEHQKTQALVFIEKTNLCRLSEFSRLSNWVHEMVVNSNDDDHTPATSQHHPSHSQKFFNQIPATSEELQLWYTRLHPAVHHRFPTRTTLSPWDRSIYLHRTWLRLLYLSMAYMVHYEESLAVADVLVDPLLSAGQFEITRHYLSEISGIFEEVYSLDLARYLPGPCATLLILVLTFHWRVVNQGSPNVQRKSSLRFHQCWGILTQLQVASELARNVVSAPGDDPSGDIWERLSYQLLL
ncbi:hypothetical protein FE257_011997 [Aspergillus nanangensis]|uniref:Xylanolytic transcriptional activator regulatory domain-containing protein n=1 Tax=Aspergillus nanangensis TaxID=2582783 RepID=A0AAD4CIE6_ASPNN|nr:hypothetical protein FE257_011997 [Aspergillus nanangensis]